MMIKRHFTLIELLMVITVMLILAAIGVGGMSGAMRRAGEADTRSRMEQLKHTLDEYYRDHGHYPVQETGGKLEIDGDFEDYFDDETLKSVPDENYKYFYDGFDQPFHYQYPGTHNEGSYDLWSLGSDEDDDETNITNW